MVVDARTSLPSIDVKQVLSRADTSFWLKTAISECMQRDPLDALADVEMLHVVLEARVKDLLG